MRLDSDTKAPDAKVKALVTDKWLKQTKKELAALEHPKDCEWQQLVKHVQGCYLGDVDDNRVFAVAADQVMRHYAMDWTTGGNHEKWSFCPEHQLWLSHSLAPDEFEHDGLHEAVERFMMAELHLSYEIAHAHANWYEQQYMDELDVGGPVKKDGDKQPDSNKSGLATLTIRLPWDAITLSPKGKP